MPGKSKRNAKMPLTRIQGDIMSVVAKNRDIDDYVVGGTFINVDGGRYSRDIDIFLNKEERRFSESYRKDVEALRINGFEVETRRRDEKEEIRFARCGVRRGNEETVIEWVIDSSYRYFPAIRDKTFGYRLHPIDSACDKLIAAANRNETRDVLDMIRIDREILPLGPLAWAASESSHLDSPGCLINNFSRRIGVHPEEIRKEGSNVSAKKLNSSIMRMSREARNWIDSVPTRTEFGLILDRNGNPIKANLSEIPRNSWSVRKISVGGAWPTSPEISTEMMFGKDEIGKRGRNGER